MQDRQGVSQPQSRVPQLRAHLWGSIPKLEPIKRQALTPPLISNSRHSYSAFIYCTDLSQSGCARCVCTQQESSTSQHHPSYRLKCASTRTDERPSQSNANQVKPCYKIKTDRMNERWNESRFQHNAGKQKAADLTQVGDNLFFTLFIIYCVLVWDLAWGSWPGQLNINVYSCRWRYHPRNGEPTKLLWQ